MADKMYEIRKNGQHVESGASKCAADNCHRSKERVRIIRWRAADFCHGAQKRSRVGWRLRADIS